MDKKTKSRVDFGGIPLFSPTRLRYYFYLNSGQTADESNKSNKKRVTASPSL